MSDPLRVAASALAAFATVFWSAAADAQTWELRYDPGLGSLPSAQGFTLLTSDPAPDDGLDEGNYLVALGALTQGDTGGPNGDLANEQHYEASTPTMDYDADRIVVDLRLKILSSTMDPPGQPTPAAGFGLALFDKGGEYVSLHVGETGLFLRGTGTTTSPLGAFDTTLGFADYELRIDASGATVLVNGAELATLDREDFGNSLSFADLVELGDRSTAQRSSSQIEGLTVSRFRPFVPEVRSFSHLTASSADDSTATKTLTRSCPPGTRPLVGGARTMGAEGFVGISESRPTGGSPPTGWTASGREMQATSQSWQLRIDLHCGELPGYENVPFSDPLDTVPFKWSQSGCSSSQKERFSAGAGIVGADLNQVLTWTRLVTSGATDFGEPTASAAAWAVEDHALCSDVTGFELVSREGVASSVNPRQESVDCPTGKVPIGGGGSMTFVDAGDAAALRASRPLYEGPGGLPSGWFADAQVPSSLWNLEAWATCAPTADPTVPKAGLVGRWQAEGDADDSWGARHGSSENGSVGYASGLVGEAFDFDGASEHWIRVPNDHAAFYPEGAFTVDAWILTDTLGPEDQSPIVNLYDFGGTETLSPNPSGWQIGLDGTGAPLGSVRSFVSSSAFTIVHGPDGLADGAPHHLALIRDMDERMLKLFVDGVLVASDTLTVNLSTEPLKPGNPLLPDPVAIGVWRTPVSNDLQRPFDGLIDDVKYWNRALTDEEVRDVAGCGLPIVPRVLNLDAERFASPAAHDQGLCVQLEAGDYEATLVSPGLDPDARFHGWSPSAGGTWSTLYTIEPEVDGSVIGGFATGSPTPEQAFDDTVIKTQEFSLTVDQRVTFKLVDDAALDNRGGVSIWLLPEPGAVVSLVAGLALLGLLQRLRQGARGKNTPLDPRTTRIQTNRTSSRP